MPKLRQAVIKRIQTSLNASPFSAEDFLVTLPSEGDVLAQIAFLPDPGYALAITGPSAGAYTTKEVPGAYYNESEYSHRNLDIAVPDMNIRTTDPRGFDFDFDLPGPAARFFNVSNFDITFALGVFDDTFHYHFPSRRLPLISI